MVPHPAALAGITNERERKRKKMRFRSNLRVFTSVLPYAFFIPIALIACCRKLSAYENAVS